MLADLNVVFSVSEDWVVRQYFLLFFLACNSCLSSALSLCFDLCREAFVAGVSLCVLEKLAQLVPLVWGSGTVGFACSHWSVGADIPGFLPRPCLGCRTKLLTWNFHMCFLAVDDVGSLTFPQAPFQLAPASQLQAGIQVVGAEHTNAWSSGSQLSSWCFCCCVLCSPGTEKMVHYPAVWGSSAVPGLRLAQLLLTGLLWGRRETLRALSDSVWFRVPAVWLLCHLL